MNAARFFIAKFVPDIRRMEPRNVGLLLWTEHGVTSRFLGEQSDDKVRAPSFVQPDNRDAYRQWVEYWKTLLAKKTIRSDSGESVSSTSPRFFDVMRTKAKSQFMLVDSGRMMDKIRVTEVGSISNELFESVVKYDHSASRHDQSSQLREATNEVFKLAGLNKKTGLKRRVQVTGKFGHTSKEITFDFAISRDSRPDVVMQRVQLPIDKSVYCSVGMFEAIVRKHHRKKSKIKPLALVYGADEASKDNRRLLEEFATVVDVSRASKAAEILGQYRIAA